MDVQNKRVLVVGLARSGLSVARALVRHGAVVTVSDRKPPGEFTDTLPELLKDKVGLELGSQSVETFLKNEIIVISPGIPWDLPQLQAAREKMIPVYPEVEAASWFLDGTLVGVTGSNGKTTTTSLLGEMLKASGFPTFVGGNIGNALSSAVDHSEPGTKFVTELSSFQLEGIHDFRPHVAVMLNLSPNHLDRHPSFEAYAQAKQQIFRNQDKQDYAVLNADDPWVAGLQAKVSSRAVFFSRHSEIPTGVFLSGSKIYYRVRHLERVLFEKRDVRLLGDFNLEDVLAATTAACLLGADFAAIRKAVREFKAVEHRLEFVMEIQGVDFYNNSKATSVDATLKSLEAFEHGVHLIMGGKDKGAPYTPLLPLIKDRVREVLLIGAAAPIIAKQFEGSTELVHAEDLATAVYQAFARSRPGDTVLLAPACSSFDQFKDYEERGMVFKELVRMLQKDVAEGSVERVPGSEARGPRSETRGARAGVPSREAGLAVGSPESRVRGPKSEVRGPRSELRTQKSEIRVPNSGDQRLESGVPGLRSGASAFESGALNHESKPSGPASSDSPTAPERIGPKGSSLDSGVSTFDAGVSILESGVSTLESGILNLESKAQTPVSAPVNLETSAEAHAADRTAGPEISNEPGEAKPPVAEAAALQADRVAEPPEITLEIAPATVELPSAPTQKAAERLADTVVINLATPLRVSFADDPESPEASPKHPDVKGTSAENLAQNISPPSSSVNREGAEENIEKTTKARDFEPAAASARSHDSNPGSVAPSPALRVPYPVSRTPSLDSRVPSPESGTTNPERRAPLELSYVYEVDAAETPESESQVVPEDEPSISISASSVEALDDQVLPFEMRTAKGKSEVRGPTSETEKTQTQAQDVKPVVEKIGPQSQSAMSEVERTEVPGQSPKPDVPKTGRGARRSGKQPKLFNGGQ